MEKVLEQKQLSERVYKKGELLYSSNSPTIGVFWIISGTVKIFDTDSESREVILRLASEGDIVGHCFLSGQIKYGDSAKAIETTRCYFFDQEELNSLMLKNPEMSLLIMRKLGQELSTVQTRCLDLIKKNVRERLASYFHYMAKKHSVADHQGLKIRVQLRREEIASMIGTANETAIRFISEFKELGLIKEHDRFFHILQPEKIAMIAKLSESQS